MRRLILGTLTGLVLVTSGCGGDDTTDARPTPMPTTASTPATPSSDPTPSQSQSPTETGVAPATGVVISSELAQVQAPADWGTNPSSTDTGGNVTGPNGNVLYNLALVDAASNYPDDSTDFAAELSQKSCCYKPPLKRLPDTTMGGQPAYHLAGDDNIFGNWADEYGIRYQGHTITVTVRTPRDLAPAKREAINASILASFQLTG